MKPLLILLLTFGISLLITRPIIGHFDIPLPARIALSCMLVFTSMAHFAFTKGMTMMVPSFIPFKKGLVFITGVIEVIAAAGLHFPSYRHLTAWLLIAFFILLLPANIKAALGHIDYQNGNTRGRGPAYLWFRVPLQLFFIAWTYFSAIQFG